MTWRWRVPRPQRFPATHKRLDVYLPGDVIERLDEQSDRWTIGPNKLIEIAVEAAANWLEGHEPGKRLPPIPHDSLNAAVASAMMGRMDPVRVVPKPNTISSIDGEDIPDVAAQTSYPEADAPIMEGDRPECDPATELVLETE